ncbi:hypothetical protein OD917_17260 [Flavobacterium sp. SH_e]|uniref:hypothetical protein n=1 Tax=Flavobacterium TaxID=237 RepID=UPI0021E40A05|nr:hypothetical protein [Flavobacterium sp. SH_e]MCV2486682.1 hypothetical protein [Flavobacterium sp. SH_e]
MKKLLLLLSVFFMLSCTSEDEYDSSGSNGNHATRISPPEWIIGKWKNEEGIVLQFTKSDLIIINSTGYQSSVSYGIDYWEEKGNDVELVETKTEDSYIFEYRDAASTKQYFNFVKTSDTQMGSKRFYKGNYTKL